MERVSSSLESMSVAEFGCRIALTTRPTKDALTAANARRVVLGKTGATHLRQTIEERQQAALAISDKLLSNWWHVNTGDCAAGD